MRFDLEGDAPAVADINDTGILPRGHDDAFAGSRQPFEMNARRLVRTVFRPHHREDAEFGKRRLPPHERLDAFKLLRSKVVGGYYLGRDWFHKK